MQDSYTYSGCTVTCHFDEDNLKGIRSPNKTISGFCATCHGNFHGVSGSYGTMAGIGEDTSSPFCRHPTDVILPDRSEYSEYTTYSVEAPVARTLVLDSPLSTVTPGSDILMCLSCHVAHASDYPDMLRWNYDEMIAGGDGNGGCFICHTKKNNP